MTGGLNFKPFGDPLNTVGRFASATLSGIFQDYKFDYKSPFAAPEPPGTFTVTGKSSPDGDPYGMFKGTSTPTLTGNYRQMLQDAVVGDWKRAILQFQPGYKFKGTFNIPGCPRFSAEGRVNTNPIHLMDKADKRPAQQVLGITLTIIPNY